MQRNGDAPWRWGGYSDKSFRMGFQLLSIFCPAIILTHESFFVVNMDSFNNLPFEPILFSCKNSGVLEQKMVPRGCIMKRNAIVIVYIWLNSR